MSAPLPHFVYHPDPLRTGSVAESGETCESCQQARGFVYQGPAFAQDEIEFLCPWCIADGSAAARLDVVFTDVEGAPPDVPTPVVEEISRRTPGFYGWQQERWLFHCGDGAEFLGRVGYADVVGRPDLLESLASDGLPEDALPHLHPDGDVTAYEFRCRHCRIGLAYWDAS